MAPYEIVFRKSVAKDFKSIFRSDVDRILDAIRSLAGNPRPMQAIKLAGVEHYRLRCGNYRVLYEIADAQLIVCVVKVGNRKDVYRT